MIVHNMKLKAIFVGVFAAVSLKKKSSLVLVG